MAPSHKFLMEDGSMVETELGANFTTFQQQVIESGDMIVGLNIEGGLSTYDEPGLLVLCTQTRCVIEDLSRWVRFRTLFNNKDIIFAGVRVKDDLEKLRKCCGLDVRNSVVDLSELAADVLHQPRLRALGPRMLASEVLLMPFKMRPVSITQSDWISGNLTKDQIECATTEAYAAYKIGKKLLGV